MVSVIFSPSPNSELSEICNVVANKKSGRKPEHGTSLFCFLESILVHAFKSLKREGAVFISWFYISTTALLLFVSEHQALAWSSLTPDRIQIEFFLPSFSTLLLFINLSQVIVIIDSPSKSYTRKIVSLNASCNPLHSLNLTQIIFKVLQVLWDNSLALRGCLWHSRKELAFHFRCLRNSTVETTLLICPGHSLLLLGWPHGSFACWSLGPRFESFVNELLSRDLLELVPGTLLNHLMAFAP